MCDPENRLEKAKYAGTVDMGFLRAGVYKNLTNLVAQAFSHETCVLSMECWESLD
ncbi:MAG: hypothetical protein ACE5JB_15325 [bacterium]